MELLKLRLVSMLKVHETVLPLPLHFNDVSLISKGIFLCLYPKEFNILMDLLFHQETSLWSLSDPVHDLTQTRKPK